MTARHSDVLAPARRSVRRWRKNLVGHDIDVQLAALDLAKMREAATALGPRARATELAALAGGIDAVFRACA